ncbi:MAG TPA: hypothetical protein VG266_00905 [Candidatus Dormibacteraeota bacterium]|jgi:hypothetical protein|nr:hypothetical protein [Candidatus Dormibacteraeota bacterium]
MADMDVASGNKASTATVLSAVRIAVGAASLLAPDLSGRIIGFPRGHLNGSSRAMGRLFGIREIVLGVLTLDAVRRNPAERRIYLANAAADGADGLVFAAALLGRQGIPRAAVGSLALALPVAATWLKLASETR